MTSKASKTKSCARGVKKLSEPAKSSSCRKVFKKTRKVSAYALFVKKQWAERGDEFKALQAKHGVKDAMKYISAEISKAYKVEKCRCDE
jgi:hypothetical protein